MSGAIFLLDSEERLVELREQPYDSEALLQSLLATHPHLLAGEQISREDPRRWLLITREARVPGEEGWGTRWAVDHLFLDHDAIPTLIEVKRSSDTRIRREVVGQLLDYAANAVVYWPAEHLREEFVSRCRRDGVNADEKLRAFLGPGADPDQFWEQARTNLQAGKLRLLFVADEIPPELRRIVEFLNGQMDRTEVLALEIRQYTGEGLRTLVPTVLGHTAGADGHKHRPKKQWDETSFFDHLTKLRPPAEVEAARQILNWVRPRTTRIWWGKGQSMASFVPVLNHAGKDHQLFAVYSTGPVEIYFYWHAYKPPFDREEARLDLLQRLNTIPGVSLGRDAIGRRPSIPLSVLAQEGALDRFLAAFEWFLEEVRKT
ncbi:MAG TPA: hypothetical protein VFQ45_17315 [Longimicrobium sp.]|nr:hypothetical protein [Longimicrobium sp.]